MGNVLPDNYVPVHARIAKFHAKFKDKSRSIVTNLIAPEAFVAEGGAVVKAEIFVDGLLLATGLSAVADLSESKALEKAETVATGRALAFAGFEITDSISSAEEMEEHAAEKGAPLAAPAEASEEAPVASAGKLGKKSAKAESLSKVSSLNPKTAALLSKFGKGNGGGSKESVSEVRR